MKLCLFLVAGAALASAPPRIELDLAPAMSNYSLANPIYRDHNDGLRQPSGEKVQSRQDYSARCTAGTATEATCPFPIAKAWDHQDKDISDQVVTRVYRVDVDGRTCGRGWQADCQCASTTDPTCQVNTVSFDRRSTYLFKYDVTDRSGNHAEQVVYALILDDACGAPNAGSVTDASLPAPPNDHPAGWCTPYITMCGDKAETWQAASNKVLCDNTADVKATDNLDGDTAMANNLMYDIQELDSSFVPLTDSSSAETYLCRNQDWNDYIDYRAGTSSVKACAADKLATTNVGRYLVTWHVCDYAGVYGHGSRNNCFSRRKVVVIQDTLKPWIDMHGYNPVVQECHQRGDEVHRTNGTDWYSNGANCADRADKDCWAYEDAGATVKDLLDTEQLGRDISQQCAEADGGADKGCLLTTGNVDSTQRDVNYNVTYRAWDVAGNDADPVTRTVEVRDRRPPTATLVSAELNPIVHYVADFANETWGFSSENHTHLGSDPRLASDAGYNCYDDCNTDNQGMKDLGGQGWANRSFACSYNNCPLGDYVRTYTCKDRDNAEALTHTVTRTFTVVDKHKPIIDILPCPGCCANENCDDFTLEATNAVEYTDFGATCSDFVDGPLSHAVEVSGEVVNMRIPGEYKIRYDCQDLSGNEADPKVRTVTIEDTTCPTVTTNGTDQVYVEAGFHYTDTHGATATDTLDGDISAHIYTYGNTVNENKAFDGYDSRDNQVNTQGAVAFKSCKEIKSQYPEATSGKYYVLRPAVGAWTQATVEVICDMDSQNADGDVVGYTYALCNATDSYPYCARVTPYGSENGSCESKFGLEMVQWAGRNNTQEWAKHPSRFGTAAASPSDPSATAEIYLCGTNDENTAGGVASKTYEKLMARDGIYKIKYFVQDKAGNNQETKANGSPCPNPDNKVLTPTRTVIVQDTLPPVITLHVDNVIDASNDAETRVTRGSSPAITANPSNPVVANPSVPTRANPAFDVQDSLGVGNPFLKDGYKAAKPANPNLFDALGAAESHRTHHGLYADAPGTAFMAEQQSTAGNAWIFGAAASAVAGVALLVAASRKQTPVTVEV